VRPPDENQNGSTRPNFMSATRRAYGGDDNILARLEREARRGQGGPWKHATLAWCVLASVLVIALIGTLASLARENMTVPTPGPEASSDQFASSVRGGFAPLPISSPNRGLGGNAYDLPAEASLLPPLVMLKPAAANAKSVAKPAQAPLVRAAAKPAKPAPERTAVAARREPVRVAATTKPAAPPPRVAAVPVRPRKAAPSASPAVEPAAVDSDVALLSAIIMHASRHSAEREKIEAARCGAGKKCAPADTFPSLKATD
jgi:hypothetical protein